MNEERLSELLKARAPGETEAEERGWRVVSAAFEDRDRPRPARPRRGLRAAAGLACALALGVAATSPPGRAVADWVRDSIRPGAERARPALTSLPTEGRLLVTSSRGPWVVQRDGSKRLLGPYAEAGWSPEGLFVVATRGSELFALEPGGKVRWSLARKGRVTRPAWAPSGFRVAYLAGTELRMVAGDGTGDRRLVRRVAKVKPAWLPGQEHVLAFADAGGRIRLIDADSRRERWRTPPGPVPSALAWTPDAGRLLALAPRSLRLLDSAGATVRTIRIPAGARASHLAVHPSGGSAAVVLTGGGRSRVESIGLEDGARRRLFAGDGRFTGLAWSPDGRWLNVAWRDADQWVFLRSTRVRKLDAVSNISRQFDPGTRSPAFPGLGDWCCPRKREPAGP